MRAIDIREAITRRGTANIQVDVVVVVTLDLAMFQLGREAVGQ